MLKYVLGGSILATLVSVSTVLSKCNFYFVAAFSVAECFTCKTNGNPLHRKNNASQKSIIVFMS